LKLLYLKTWVVEPNGGKSNDWGDIALKGPTADDCEIPQDEGQFKGEMLEGCQCEEGQNTILGRQPQGRGEGGGTGSQLREIPFRREKRGPLVPGEW